MVMDTIQHIIFPDDYSLEDSRKLFFRGDHGRLTEISSKGHLQLGKGQWVDFCTYLNGVSYAKWKKYTSAAGLTLTLDYQGKAEIILVGYKLLQNKPVREVINRIVLSSTECCTIELEIPDNDQTMIGFEISAISDFELFGGFYTVSVPETKVRSIELALLTTTFKRENFIKHNMQRMKEGLFDTYPEVGDHIRMHIVDNGRTLKKEDLPDDPIHFELHPNPNVGGAGGFARGMIECLHQKPEATHGLLMDDDIMILPESIFRTYQLLRFMKPEYHTSFIGGAMLLLEDKVIQLEDFACVHDDGYWGAIKPRFDQAKISDNLKNEQDFSKVDIYQAWWYCCIPVEVIRKNGLPLPLFIHGDDVEYGLRCKEHIITMNGICLWHMGFDGKYNPALSVYQDIRNLLIDQATSKIFTNIDLFTRFKNLYLQSILKHDYVTCELSLRALEDYMKGPDFLMEDRGEQIIKENNSILDKMIPYGELNIKDFNKDINPYADYKSGFLKRLWKKITWNGHILWPDRWLKDKIVFVPRDQSTFPGKTTNKRTIVALDAFNEKACIWIIDKKRFKQLQKRYYADLNFYKKNKEKIQKTYQEKGQYLKSEEFWRKYLKMDQ